MLENLIVCKWCKTEKPLKDFSFENKKQNKRKHYCKACNQARLKKYYDQKRVDLLAKKKKAYVEDRPKYLEKSRQYRRKNPEKVKAAMDRWLQENPDSQKANRKKRKAVIRGALAKQISLKEIQRLLASKCVYCGSSDQIQIDHVVPIARGGLHSIGNLAPACQSCNASKNKWLLTEWKKINRERAKWH